MPTQSEKLPYEILARREQLPEKPSPVTLIGKYVRLEPLQIERDAYPLFNISNGSPILLNDKSMAAYDADDMIWQYVIDGPFHDIHSFEENLKLKLSFTGGLCFCAFDLASNHQIGLPMFINSTPKHLKIELCAWFSPIVQHTHVITETAYLMLNHAFNLGYRRVEWKCHASNGKSYNAALRLGFKFEGIHQSDMIVKGCNRDTAFFRMLSSEWPEIKIDLEQSLYSGN